jgi:hypothetical protein
MAGVPLAAALRELRAQLLESIEEAKGEELWFALGTLSSSCSWR